MHEIAHNYDAVLAQKFGLQFDKFSASNIWHDAVAADQQLQGNPAGVTPYATKVLTDSNNTNAVEDFAEAVSLYYNDPDALNRFPNRKRILEKYLPKN